MTGFLIVLCVIVGFVAWIACIAAPFFLMERVGDDKWWHWLVCWTVSILIFAVPIAALVTKLAEEDGKPFDGYVYKKTYYPPTTTYVMSGKVIVPIHHEARYNLVLKNTDDQRACDVDPETFSQLELGQNFHCGGY